MVRSNILGGWIVLLPLACLALTPASPIAERPTASTPKDAIERSLAYLERDGDAWMEGKIPIQGDQGCVSCHQVPFGLWSLREAQRAGVAIPQEPTADLEERARAFVAQPGTGRAMSWAPLLLGRQNPEPVAEAARQWQAFREALVSAQGDDGLWQAKGQFPSQKRPVKETDAVATHWTLLALFGFGDGNEAALASRDKALGWIEAAPPGKSNEWLLTKMLVEKASGEGEAAREHLRQLLAAQQEDGGWSFAPGDPSNAYSTGQSLYALRRVGLEAHHPAVERAVRHLLQTQAADGTWAVPSKLTSSEPSPGKDYVYAYWGTAWAVIGLAQVAGEA